MRQSPDYGSLRSGLVAAGTRLTLRPLTAVVPANRPGVRISRAIVARSLAAFGPPLRSSSVVQVRRPTGQGPEVRGEWVRGPGARREDAVVLYVHGSAYTICSSRTHRGITTRLSRETGLPVFACDYRLAPTHRFPSSADDVRAAYDWLLAEGHPPERIVLAGDSAGGHLAIDLTLQLIREGRPAPAALLLLSPVLDLTMGLAAARERVRRDPMISAGRAARLLDLYTVDADRSGHRLAFTFAGAREFPPTLVQAGGREMLAADAEWLAKALEEAGAFCELEIWRGQMHVFQALSRLVPEAEQALARSGRFVVEQLEHAGRRAALTSVQEA
jgi:monoterpene epsilon-lactone hydrolase